MTRAFRIKPAPRRLALLAGALATATLGLLLAGCNGAGPASHFPLGRGDHWDYDYREQRGEQVTVSEAFTIDDASPVSVDGERRYRRRTSNTTEYWLREHDGWIERVGVRTGVELEPALDEAPRRVLPVAPKVGDQWSISTQPYALERVMPFRERFTRDESLRFDLHLRVTATDETIEVAAGRFEHCVKVEGSGHFYVLADARIGASEVPVTQTEWYAPGVGLVKLQRDESLDTPTIFGGSVTLELTGHHR